MGKWGNGENGEMGKNGEKRGKWGIGDGDGYRSPQNSPSPFSPNGEMGRDGGRVWEVGMGMGGPISIPIPQTCISNYDY